MDNQAFNSRTLRHEAGPDHDLTEEQKQLRIDILALFGRLLRQIHEPLPPLEPPFNQFLERLHEGRHNHVVLIEGQRGAGKTTLLLKLLSEWQRGNEDDHDYVLPKSGESLRVRPRRIVPLRIVDLQTVPTGSSLLLQLTQQLALVSNALQDATPRDHALRSAWDEFLRAAAANGSGTIESRRSRLDLQNFTAELEEALVATPRLKDAFEEFMNQLSARYAAWSGLKAPLFVLPIDDADMNPERSSELLSATRTLWHPNLVFLITGSAELLRIALRGQCLSLLRAPLRAQHLSELELGWQGAADGAALLAEQTLDKAVPRHQRFGLQRVEVWRRVDADAPVKDLLRGATFPTMQSLQIGPVKFSASLGYYLQHDRLLNRVFKLSERSFRDFKGSVFRLDAEPVSKKERESRISKFCEQLWRTGLDQSALLADDRRMLNDAVQVREDGSLYVDPSCLDWLPGESYVRSFVAPEAPWLDCHILRTTSVRGVPRLNPRRPQPVTAELNPLAVGALMLTTDVVADHATWRVVQMPSFGSRGIALVETEYTWGTHVVRFVWPTPDWPAFIDHSVLVDAWASVDATYLMELSLIELSYCMAWVVAKVANNRAELAAAFAEKSAEKPPAKGASQSASSAKPAVTQVGLAPPLKERLKDELREQLKELCHRLGDDTNRHPQNDAGTRKNRRPAQIDATRNSANRRWLDALALFSFEEYVGAGNGDGRNGWAHLLRHEVGWSEHGMRVESLRVQLAQRALTKPDYRPTPTEAESMLKEIETRAREGRVQPKTP